MLSCMGLVSLFFGRSQYIGHIPCALMMQFFRKNNDLGHLLQTSYMCMSIELGLSDCPFSYDYERYAGCVTHSWMKHLWIFCDTKNIELRRVCSNFKHKKKHDKNLMQYFTNNGIHWYQLASVNQCQLYLKVVLLSNITTGDGRYIERSIYEGVPNNCITDTYEWPIQGKPGKMDWHEWKRALESIFGVSTTTLCLSKSYQINEWDEDISSL